MVVTYLAMIGPAKPADRMPFTTGRKMSDRRLCLLPAGKFLKQFHDLRLVPVSRSDLAGGDPAVRRDDKSGRNALRVKDGRDLSVLHSQKSHGVMAAIQKSADRFGIVVGRNAHELNRFLQQPPIGASLSMDGISRTQGPHHVAQKLRKTVLPLNFENETG